MVLSNSKNKGCDALVRAHNAFINLRKSNNLYKENEKFIIVMVTQLVERNCIDIRGMEQALLEKYNVPLRGYSFLQLSKVSRINENFDLIMYIIY